VSLDLLGAGGLQSQYITLRVKHIDVQKLGRKLGGTAGAAIPTALALVDLAPGPALKAAMPHVATLARNDYGVDLEYSVTDAPLPKGERPSQAPGIVKGLGIAGLVYLAWHYGRPLLKK
jgi:hypothetical protein